MQRETPVSDRPRAVSALRRLAGGGLAAAAALAVTAAPAHAASGPDHAAQARRAAQATEAPSVGPRTPGNPEQQLTTSMMPPGSPDAHPTSPPTGTQTGKAAHATTSYLYGVDTASYQHPGGTPITWSQVRASGQSFAVVKATEGTTYTNPYMTADAGGARAAGLRLGLYHFAQPGFAGGSTVADAQAEADFFSRQVNSVGGLQLPPTLDLEITNGLKQADMVSWTAAFLQRVQADTGRQPMIYTGPWFWGSSVGSTAFTTYPLWDASYTTAANPPLFGGWSHWTIWQYTDGYYFSPSTIGGIAATYTDRDRFAGTDAQLTGFATASTGNVAPFTGTASAASYPDGSLVQLAGDPAIYVMAGLAPVYLPSFSVIGGPRAARVLSAAQFYSLRSSPADGTWMRAHETGQVYRVIGGAPLYVPSFAAFGGTSSIRSMNTVGQSDFDRAGSGGYWNRLLAKPADGTFVAGADTGQVYRVVGGAPVYVSSWSYFGGPQPSTSINQATIDRAREGGVFAHLNYTPAEGALIADPTAGTYWQVVGGQITPVANTGQAFVAVGDTAIIHRNQPGVWAHLV